MLRKIIKWFEPFDYVSIFLLCVFIGLSGFSIQNSGALSQPKDERNAQNALPKSHDAMWVVLGKVKINLDKKNWKYSAVLTDEVKALAGKDITISGFILPLENAEKFKHFLISKRTPTCPFCPPGEPNEIVDVWLEKPISWNMDMLKVTGKFELINNQENGMFFKLNNAKIEEK